MHGGRKIVVDGVTYEYRVGRGNTTIRWENGNAFGKPGNAMLVGVSYDVYERGQHKRTSDGAVTPKHIASFIKDPDGTRIRWEVSQRIERDRVVQNQKVA